MVGPVTFRKLPGIVEAMKVSEPGGISAILTWIAGRAPASARPDSPDTLMIHTREGVKFAGPGSWVVKDEHDEFFTMPSETFSDTYEPTPDGPPAPPPPAEDSELPLDEWIEDNIRRAQNVHDGTANERTEGEIADCLFAIGLTLNALVGVGLLRLQREQAPSVPIPPRFGVDMDELARLARDSEPLKGPGQAARRDFCGCIVEWVADAASPAYKQHMMAAHSDCSWIPMDYEAAQRELAIGRGCPHGRVP